MSKKESRIANFKIYKRLIGLFLSKEATIKKNLNLIKAVINWKILKSFKLTNYPLTLMICPGNVCVLNCEMCPTGLNHNGRKKGLMRFETFKKIMDECGPYIYRLSLYNWGEPLLNKDLFKMIDYAKKFKIRITISSNLRIFNHDYAESLVKSGVDWIVVSLDGASNESVVKYQKGNNFNNAFENMVYLAKLRDKYNKKLPIVEWRFVVNAYNENEIAKARHLASQNNLRIGFVPIVPFPENIYFMKDAEIIKLLEKWKPKNDKYSMLNKFGNVRKFADECTWVWFSSSINWNGSISPCCSWHEKFDFGNCLTSSFFSVWNNEKYQKARNILSTEIKDNSLICGICKKNKRMANFF